MAAANLETVELNELGDTAIEVGLYMIKGEGSTVVDEGKYLIVWKQEEGHWKYHRDIWNSSIPTE